MMKFIQDLETIAKESDEFINSLIELLPKNILSEYVYNEATSVCSILYFDESNLGNQELPEKTLNDKLNKAQKYGSAY